MEVAGRVRVFPRGRVMEDWEKPCEVGGLFDTGGRDGGGPTLFAKLFVRPCPYRDAGAVELAARLVIEAPLTLVARDRPAVGGGIEGLEGSPASSCNVLRFSGYDTARVPPGQPTTGRHKPKRECNAYCFLCVFVFGGFRAVAPENCVEIRSWAGDMLWLLLVQLCRCGLEETSAPILVSM